MEDAAVSLEPGTRIVDVSGSNYQDIPDFGPISCRSCLRWEMGNGSGHGPGGDREALKRNWFNGVNFVYGPCGKLVYHNGKVVAWAQYAPANCFPKSGAYHSYPSQDAYLITCLVVAPKYRRRGFGEMLLRAIIEDLRGRGLKAVETFAMKNGENNPSGPVELYRSAGFKTEADDEHLPLLRLELQEIPVTVSIESLARL